MIYSRQQLLEQWMLRKYMVPLRTDCTVSRAESGDDHATLASLEMDDWYLDLLDNAPRNLLDPVDIADDVATLYHRDRRMLEVRLPEDCRRVVEITVKGCSGALVPVKEDSAKGRLQASGYSCGGRHSPVAVATGNRLLIYAADEAGNPPEIDHLMAVTASSDGLYRLDPRALSTIPKEMI